MPTPPNLIPIGDTGSTEFGWVEPQGNHTPYLYAKGEHAQAFLELITGAPLPQPHYMMRFDDQHREDQKTLIFMAASTHETDLALAGLIDSMISLRDHAPRIHQPELLVAG